MWFALVWKNTIKYNKFMSNKNKIMGKVEILALDLLGATLGPN